MNASGSILTDTTPEDTLAEVSLRRLTGEQQVAARKAASRAAILNGPILRTLFRLAWPTMAVLLAQTSVNIAEAYYVGRLGTDALAGVALVFPVYMLMTMMSAGGFGSGVASAIARAIGAGRQHDADALVLHAIVLAIIVGLLFTLGAVGFGPTLYHALGGRGGTLADAQLYSTCLFVGSVGVWVVNLLAAALRGSGNVRIPALVTLVGAVVLIAASPALIFGFGPIPRLGIAGAGISFAAYYGAAALVLLRYMASGRSGLVLRRSRLERRLFADILRVGLPTALSAIQTNLGVILITGAIGLSGTTLIAAFGIDSRLDYVLIPILFGLSSGVLTMVGVNMGAGHTVRARRIAWQSSLVGVLLTETIGVAVAVDPLLWVHLFTHDPQVVHPAAVYLRIVAPAYGLLGFGFVVSFAAQGAGHVLWPYLGVTARMLVVGGLSWLVADGSGGGLHAIALVVVGSLAIYATLSGIAMFSQSVWRPYRALI